MTVWQLFLRHRQGRFDRRDVRHLSSQEISELADEAARAADDPVFMQETYGIQPGPELLTAIHVMRNLSNLLRAT